MLWISDTVIPSPIHGLFIFSSACPIKRVILSLSAASKEELIINNVIYVLASTSPSAGILNGTCTSFSRYLLENSFDISFSGKSGKCFFTAYSIIASSAAITNAVDLENINRRTASSVSIATSGKHRSRSSIKTTSLLIPAFFIKSSNDF